MCSEGLEAGFSRAAVIRCRSAAFRAQADILEYADRLQQTGVYLSILDIILFARHMNKAGTLLASMFGVGVTVGSHPRAGDLRHPGWHSARKPGGITW